MGGRLNYETTVNTLKEVKNLEGKRSSSKFERSDENGKKGDERTSLIEGMTKNR